MGILRSKRKRSGPGVWEQYGVKGDPRALAARNPPTQAFRAALTRAEHARLEHTLPQIFALVELKVRYPPKPPRQAEWDCSQRNRPPKPSRPSEWGSSQQVRLNNHEPDGTVHSRIARLNRHDLIHGAVHSIDPDRTATMRRWV